MMSAKKDRFVGPSMEIDTSIEIRCDLSDPDSVIDYRYVGESRSPSEWTPTPYMVDDIEFADYRNIVGEEINL